MVLGLRSKSKQITSIQVEYTVEVLEIKPWPSSQALKSIHSVVLQWETGDRKIGLTNPITPSLSEEKIEINEIFRLHVTLMKESSRRSNGGGSFHKNILQFYLHEHKKDKAVKGQLGTAVLDLAQHGIIEDSLRVGLPLTFKRTLRNVGQPVLYINLRSFEKSGPESSSSESVSKEVSLDGDGKGSVLSLMSEEYAEEDEIASFTDEDDATSHSSPTNSYSFVENNVVLPLQRSPEEKSRSKNVSETALKEAIEEGQAKQESLNVLETALIEDNEEGQAKHESLFHDAYLEPIDRSAQSSPVGLSIDPGSSKNDDLDFSKTHIVCSEAPLDISGTQTLPLSLNHEEEEEVLETTFRSTTNKTTFRNYNEVDVDNGAEHVEDDQIHNSYSSGAIPQLEESNGSLSRARRKLSFLVRSPPHIVQSNGHTNANQCFENLNEIGIVENVSNGVRHESDNGANDTTKSSSSFHRRFSDKKVHELECRVELLEGELREAAAMEMGLYSVVAEHGSSMHKVHTPARRLSRLYLYALNFLSGEKRAGTARSVVSGLVIVVKACGNDVPRLTFWLSNLVVLRAIVSHGIGQSEKPKSSAHSMEDVGTGVTRDGKIFSLKWESIPLRKKIFLFNKEFNDWDNPQTLAAALEKVEAWIFARIVESVWWQTFTPYMQSSKEGCVSKSFSRWKKFEKESSLGKKSQNSSSFEIWKIAFQDACELLCPVRAEGHECGCLPMLSKQVMEQCVARLDVAMFNALLRESDDETSTDPVADPIINHMVLPFPPGRLSFGAGAQLKNTIGNWSRSLTDLFGIDEDSSPDKNDVYDERADVLVSLKSFHLLNALSDVFMLPKHMLLERKVRKEVCPAFSSTVIRRILSNFFPDEFCPDQIPASVFEALDSEDQMMPSEDGMIRNFPCNASPIIYSPPSVASIQKIIGDVQRTSQMKRSRSSVLRKCHASDDELEELDSPFSAIIFDDPSSSSVKAKEKTSINSFRYQLLCDVWKFDD